MRSPILILFPLLAACSPSPERDAAPPPEPLSAAHLSELIAADGAAHTVAVLSGPADPTGIQKVFDGVATGASDWLAVVPNLRPGLSTDQADRLDQALGAALTRNARGVLTLAPDHADLDRVCPFGAEARAAVFAVADPGLQDARAICLRSLESAAAEMRPGAEHAIKAGTPEGETP